MGDTMNGGCEFDLGRPTTNILLVAEGNASFLETLLGSQFKSEMGSILGWVRGGALKS